VGLTRESLASLTPTAVENVRRILEGHPPLHICNPQVLPAWTERWGGRSFRRVVGE
jgi:hypothetical protein